MEAETPKSASNPKVQIKTRIRVQSLRQELDELLSKLAIDPLTIGRLRDGLGPRGHAVLTLLLAFPFVLPIPLPGLSTPFGVVIAVAGFAVAMGRLPWLPKRWLEIKIEGEKLRFVQRKIEPWLVRIEKFVRPRMTSLTVGSTQVRLHGALIFFAAVVLALPAPPGGNVMPALSIIFSSLALAEEDGLFTIFALVFLALGVGYFAGLFYFAEKIWA